MIRNHLFIGFFIVSRDDEFDSRPIVFEIGGSIAASNPIKRVTH